MEHLNSFCVLLGEVISLNADSPEFKEKLKVMTDHYRFFNKNQEQYVNKWRDLLVKIGFYILLHCPESIIKVTTTPIDLTGVEEDSQVSLDKKYYLLRKERCHKDKKIATIGNYCEFSTPFSNLSDEEKYRIYQITINNQKNTDLAMKDPHTALKRSKISNTPVKWTLPDSERDW